MSGGCKWLWRWWWFMTAVVVTVWACDGCVRVWMDDGNGKTIRGDELNSEEAAELARDILHVLDLPTPSSRPRHHHRHHHYRPSHAQGSAPTWLKGIYEVLDEHGQATSDQMDANHRETVTAADTIITFVSRNPRKGLSQDNLNRRLYFDVRDVPLDHSLLGAEIRVHRLPGYKEHVHLHVYLITSEDGNESEVAKVVLQEPGWTSVNITTSALSWLIFPHTNFGLRLAVTSLNKKHERRFHEVGLSGAHDEEDFRPFMVGYFALPESLHQRNRIRTRRSVGTNLRSRPRTYRDVTDRSKESETWCRLKHLHVSFRDLGWESWVIAPEGYDANYCQGRCGFPLHAKMNASNHALIQTLVELLDAVVDESERPPSACCAPIDLTTIPVLYYSKEKNIVLKKYPKMIVKSCGCL